MDAGFDYSIKPLDVDALMALLATVVLQPHLLRDGSPLAVLWYPSTCSKAITGVAAKACAMPRFPGLAGEMRL
jgi:hypothetical protein